MTGPISERQVGPETTPDDDGKFELGKLGRAVRRQAPLIAACAFVGAVIGAAIIIGSVQRFVAVETVLLDEERSNLLDQVSAVPYSVRSDSAVQSEIEIIKSRVLAANVVDKLRLDEDQAFLNPPVDTTSQVIDGILGLADPVLDLIAPQDPPTAPAETPLAGEQEGEEAGDVNTAAAPRPALIPEQTDPAMIARDRAIAIVRSGLSVNRVGRSLVIQIAYEGYAPDRTAAIARAYGESYTRFQLETTTEVAINAGEWIQQRLSVLERQSLDAARDVQRYRAENNLVQVHGDLLTDQQQSEMTSQMIKAAADTAQAKARLDNFESLMEETGGDVVTVSALETGTPSEDMLKELRSDYLDVERRLQSILDDYGPDHPQAEDLEKRAESLRSAIANELERAMAAIRANYTIARSREQTLRSELATIGDMANSESADLGRLRQLEAISETYAQVYRDYLERYELTTQQQGFPIASVRTLSRAEVPKSASAPRKKLILITGLALGALIGIAIGALRELRAQPLRTGEELREELGLVSAGLVPRLADQRSSDRASEISRRTLARLRQAIVYGTLADRGRIIGLAAVSGDCGSERAALIVQLCATLSTDGERVLVVDAGGASAELEQGLGDLDGVSFAAAADVDAMPAPAEDAGMDSETARQIEVLRSDFDFVLLILPPLTRMVSLDSLSRLFDISVLMVPWGEVSPALVRGALRDHPAFARALATTVLVGANLRKARRYMRSGDYEERIVHG